MKIKLSPEQIDYLRQAGVPLPGGGGKTAGPAEGLVPPPPPPPEARDWLDCLLDYLTSIMHRFKNWYDALLVVAALVFAAPALAGETSSVTVPEVVTGLLAAVIVGAVVFVFLPVPRPRDTDRTRHTTVLENNSVDVEGLIKCAVRDEKILRKPRMPSKNWTLGVVSHQGRVRERNEDCCAALDIAGLRIAIVCDGLGGEPHGDKASRAAVSGALEHIISFFGRRKGVIDPVMVAASAIRAASQNVSKKAKETGGEGFRTTCIVFVSSLVKPEYAYSYIGDGGIAIIRGSGEVEHLLAPQRPAGKGNSAFLDASLGPTQDGTPVVGRAQRRAGDLVAISTDGFAERVETSMYRFLYDASIKAGGDLQKLAESVITQVIDRRGPSGGLIFDDNVTLVLMANAKTPPTAALPAIPATSASIGTTTTLVGKEVAV